MNDCTLRLQRRGQTAR